MPLLLTAKMPLGVNVPTFGPMFTKADSPVNGIVGQIGYVRNQPGSEHRPGYHDTNHGNLNENCGNCASYGTPAKGTAGHHCRLCS